MIFLYKRNLQTATAIASPDISPISEVANLYDTRLSTYALFAPAGNTVSISIPFDEALQFDTIGIGGHSFGEGTTISINGGEAFPVPRRHAVINVGADSQTDINILITDPTLIARIPRYIGRLEIGEGYKTPDISAQIKLDNVSNSEAILSASRQSYGYRKAPYARSSFQFPYITTDERRVMGEFFQYVDVFVPFFVGMDEDCIEVFDNYVILEETQTLSFQLSEALHYTSSITVSEVF
ncbi:MAG: hypothetical protein DRI69_01880 [Bacteroidetes bacterium]|nr:MAG: hypothetical protein DRI69_01880 [Bacteroidota bacterium]